MRVLAVWDDVIPSSDLQIMSAGGMGLSQIGFGQKSALLIVDMSYGFADSSFPLGHGAGGKAAVQSISGLLALARRKGLPVIYTTSVWRDNPVERGLWKRTPEVNSALRHPKAYEIVSELAPTADETVIIKMAPSAFYGTDLLRYLVQYGVDTIILTGMVTSGCVYATAVDGFSNGFRVIIPEEGVADRCQISHKVALFNFHMKYGDVMQMTEVMDYLR